jgi:selT/selW/selH-like putative selenoprotein
LAEAIEAKYGITPKLIPSSGGVFEITVDGSLIFSKKSLGRFPEEDEIFSQIDGRTRA